MFRVMDAQLTLNCHLNLEVFCGEVRINFNKSQISIFSPGFSLLLSHFYMLFIVNHFCLFLIYLYLIIVFVL